MRVPSDAASHDQPGDRLAVELAAERRGERLEPADPCRRLRRRAGVAARHALSSERAMASPMIRPRSSRPSSSSSSSRPAGGHRDRRNGERPVPASIGRTTSESLGRTGWPVRAASSTQRSIAGASGARAVYPERRVAGRAGGAADWSRWPGQDRDAIGVHHRACLAGEPVGELPDGLWRRRVLGEAADRGVALDEALELARSRLGCQVARRSRRARLLHHEDMAMAAAPAARSRMTSIIAVGSHGAVRGHGGRHDEARDRDAGARRRSPVAARHSGR